MNKKKLLYKPVEGMIQRENSWLEWRKSGIGASEMSVIMGSLPFAYEDVLELWKKKMGFPVPEFIVTEAIQNGIDTEDEALQKVNDILGVEMSPQCFTHPEHSFLRASLDGITDDLKIGVEIKCPGITKWREARKGIVVDYYYTQVQQQMACSGLDSSYYWVYRKDEGGSLLRIPRNDEYIAEIIKRGEFFWKRIQEGVPVLPRDFNFNMFEKSSPFKVGNMETEFIEFYKN